MILKKLMIIFISVTFLIALGYGLIVRQTFTDFTSAEDMLDNFYVHLMPANIASLMNDVFEDEVVPNSEIIIRGRATGNLEREFKLNRQTVIVEEIFKDLTGSLTVGDEISIHDPSWRFWLGFSEENVIGTGFSNLLNKEQDYLIFLNDKISPLTEGLPPSYPLASAALILSSVFAYDDMEHTIITVPEGTPVPFTEVQGNEFFVSSEEALNYLMSLKHRLLEQFPRSL